MSTPVDCTGVEAPRLLLHLNTFNADLLIIVAGLGGGHWSAVPLLGSGNFFMIQILRHASNTQRQGVRSCSTEVTKFTETITYTL